MIAVAEGGSIVPLIQLLESPSITCCEAAAWALKNIACHEDNVILICQAHGIQGLVSLLNKNLKHKQFNNNNDDDKYDDEFNQYFEQDNQKNYINENNYTNFVGKYDNNENVEDNSNYWRLIEAIVSALGALICCKENKLLFGDLGAIGSLLQLIKKNTSDR